jgi:hypothetical protein
MLATRTFRKLLVAWGSGAVSVTGRLVFGWGTTHVDDDPAVREGDDRGISVEDDFAAEDIGVEASRASYVLRHDEVGEQDAGLWGRERCHFSFLSSLRVVHLATVVLNASLRSSGEWIH